MMKASAFILLLACALPAAAQRPEIVEFTPGGTLTWSNAQVNGCYAMELTWNLEYNWIHMASSMRAIQSVMRTEDGGDLTTLYYNVLAYARALGDTPQALYFRILTSPDPIQSSTPTNWLRVSNASIDELSGRLGPKHRDARHHSGGVEQVRRRWGDRAALAAEIHIRKDCQGRVPTEKEVQMWGLFGPKGMRP